MEKLRHICTGEGLREGGAEHEARAERERERAAGTSLSQPDDINQTDTRHKQTMRRCRQTIAYRCRL
jgi:hypothetical protein